jgi:FG-GAP repeat protein
VTLAFSLWHIGYDAPGARLSEPTPEAFTNPRSIMKRTLLAALLTITIVYSIPATTLSAAATETKLSASDAFINQNFGTSLAIDGNTAVVGAPDLTTVADAGFGAAYVYVRTASGWQFQQKLTASDASPHSFFGISVAIDNDTIVVGAHGVANATGAAYVFVRSGNTWTEQQRLAGSENSPSDSFGLSVGIKGDATVVGAFGNGNGGFATVTWGVAYVFTRTGNTWTETQKLKASDASTAGDFNSFGTTVAISEDTIAVGAIGNEGFSGAVYIFTFDGTQWVEQEKLHAQDATPKTFFGYRISISGDTLVAASQGWVDATIETSTPAAVYIFRQTPSGWHQQKRIFITDAGLLGQFNLTAAVSGNTIVVGCPIDFTVAPYSGSAYIFKRNGESSWAFSQKIFASDAARDDLFGSTVAISGNTAVIGAIGKSDVAPFAGATYIYDF